MVTFTQAIRTCLKEKFFKVSGRAPRSEYWWFSLFMFPVTTITLMLFGAAPSLFGVSREADTSKLGVIAIGFSVLLIVYAIPMVTVSVRRLHDRNLTGWLLVAYLVSGVFPWLGFAVAIVLLVIFCLPGTKGDNKYGPDPFASTTTQPVAGQETSQTDSIFCSQCGTSIDPVAKFCANCGTLVTRPSGSSSS